MLFTWKTNIEGLLVFMANLGKGVRPMFTILSIHYLPFSLSKCQTITPPHMHTSGEKNMGREIGIVAQSQGDECEGFQPESLFCRFFFFYRYSDLKFNSTDL